VNSKTILKLTFDCKAYKSAINAVYQIMGIQICVNLTAQGITSIQLPPDPLTRGCVLE